ncbi:MAG TPA: cytochrome c oxidase assembly protein [Gaiellaceae bacterium]|nr:cytochrome c oxidase assembly protein [Gaiellaceae bacterium]
MDVLTHWSVEPSRLLPVAIAAFLYWRRASTLRRRGAPVPAWRQLVFALGLAVLLLATVSPIDWIGEERLFSVHMLQHVLLGDIAPLCIVAGLTGPLLRPILQFSIVERLRFLAHPLVALPLWAINLLAWHLPAAYEAALRSDGVHAVQHLCFFTFGALMWAPVVEVLPGPEWFGTGWKLGYIVVVRLVETVLGNVFLWTNTVVYARYEDTPRLWGMSPLADQGTAGGVMMIEGSLVTIGALAWLFLKLAAEGELRQQLLERGLDPRAVNRAVRYGRAEELRR